MRKVVVVQSHVEVSVPGNFYLGGAERFGKELEALFAEHVEWWGVRVHLVRRAACSNCGRDWEPDRDYPDNCGYCGEVDAKTATLAGV